jgi:hemolysin activation/secretion protein
MPSPFKKRPAGWRFTTWPLLLSLLGLHSLATHAAGPVTPGVGSILQQVRPVTPPAAPSSTTGLSIEGQSVGVVPSSMPFQVNHIEITGNTKIDTPTLHGLIADSEGKSLTLPQLGELAARITDYYHAHDYPLARALIPAQTMSSGVVRIEVIEARYGKINLDNRSRVSDSLLQATLGGLQSGAVVTQAEIDRSLLLLSDIPGVAVNAALRPGAAVGTSDLQVNTSLTPMITGNVTADNDGNSYTGRERLSATVNVIDPLHHGDVLSISGLSSGSRTNYGRLAYETLLNGDGSRLGGAYSALDYKLGGPLESLDAHGSAQVASLWTKQPLIRSRNLNLYGQIQYDHLQLNDDIDISAIQTKRHLDNLTASLSGDVRDGFLSGAVNIWTASWTYGHVSFNNADAQLNDAATTNTQGGFSKWNLGATRVQGLGSEDALYLSAAGQWASGNLDPSQQMIVGGPYSVRAYDIAAVSGDVGYLFTAELRHTFPTSWHGQWQVIAFVDSARVIVNQTVFAPGANGATLNGLGIGLNWTGPNRLSASAYVAAPFGPTPELVGTTASARVWLQLSKGF